MKISFLLQYIVVDRIAHYLDTGETLSAPREKRVKASISDIYMDTKIEPDFVCTEKPLLHIIKFLRKRKREKYGHTIQSMLLGSIMLILH